MRFVGANDGGSSTAFLIELARVLKAAPPAMPIELLFLDGEEAVGDWTRTTTTRYGSRYYVEAAKKDGTLGTIAALILVDMIGDSDLRHQAGDAVDAVADRHHLGSGEARSGGREFVDEETPIEDDHMPFLEAGVPGGRPDRPRLPGLAHAAATRSTS